VREGVRFPDFSLVFIKVLALFFFLHFSVPFSLSLPRILLSSSVCDNHLKESTYTHTYVHTRKQTHIHTHTHTHAPAQQGVVHRGSCSGAEAFSTSKKENFIMLITLVFMLCVGGSDVMCWESIKARRIVRKTNETRQRMAFWEQIKDRRERRNKANIGLRDDSRHQAAGKWRQAAESREQTDHAQNLIEFNARRLYVFANNDGACFFVCVCVCLCKCVSECLCVCVRVCVYVCERWRRFRASEGGPRLG
jgi:hypothetical protein